MIHVTIYQNNRKECIGFAANGHAGYAPEGQDIVCAAASVLMINTLNAIEAFTDAKTSLRSDAESGMIDFQVKRDDSGKALLLLNTMILGLESVAENENFATYIQITFEEVQQP